MQSFLTPEQHADLYDAENTWTVAEDFFFAFIDEQPRSRVLDLGCGTGRLTIALARAGHRVTGLDPHAGSLAAARTKPGAQAVDWIDGTSAQLPPGTSFDAVLMSSHVAQAIDDDDEWQRTLADIRSALRPGGRLVFDSRDPRARAWERWTPGSTRSQYTLADGTGVHLWIDAQERERGLVAITEHRLLADGNREFEDAVLAFRSEEQLRTALAAADLQVDAVFGGWHREPVGRGAGELIVVAHR
ncbi:MAG: class I SAM-dependent methyltransferase [Paeniglutamicibacter sp.]